MIRRGQWWQGFVLGVVDGQTCQHLPKAEERQIAVGEEALQVLEMDPFQENPSHLPWRIVSELEEVVVLPFAAQVVLAALEGYHRCSGSREVVEAGAALVRSGRPGEVEGEQEVRALDR